MLRGRKLLLADDSIAIQKVIELTFVDEGMQVVSVGDGRQAIERLREVGPDIVLADVFMPELNGYQVCERIRADEQFRHIPVILLVGSFEPFNEAEARRVGADDYLTKPFQSIRQMVSKVGSLLTGHKSEEQQGATPEELPTQSGQAGTEGRAGDLELSTADTAPLPPHMRPETHAGGSSSAKPKRPFAEMQLDDKMIEETPANKFGSGGQIRAGSQQRSNEQAATPDLAEVGFKASGAGQMSATSGGANAPADSGSPPARSNASGGARNSDDSLLDLDDLEMPHSAAMAEADDFILDLQDEPTAQSQAASSARAASHSQAYAPSPAKDSGGGGMMAEPAEGFRFYQQGGPSRPEATPSIQSTAEPFRGQEANISRSESQLAPTERLPESFQPAETPGRPGETSAPKAAPTGGRTQQQGQIGLDQLSPEVIDQIARRVVEQLSTKAVEKIAWEVVPQLAELLIKRRLEEENSRPR